MTATTTTSSRADAYGTEPGDPSRARRIGGAGRRLSPEEVTAFVAASFARLDVDGRRVCLVVPDGTRTCPLPLLLRAAHEALAGRAAAVTVVIALGTHHGMSEEQLGRHLGYEPGHAGDAYPGWTVLNHESWDPATFTTLGTIGAERLTELTGGLMTDTSVTVRINRHVAEADVAVVVGPVFPHEVVGFSGGNKYFFPGVSGQELIDLSHWVGALITSAEMIGTGGTTPVRALINEAATMIDAQRLALCLVVASGTDTLHAAAFGAPEDAWAACAEVSAQTHVTYLDAPVRRVLSIMPTKYEDIWTAAKGFYKLEPVVADGGEVIIYAPHITEVSVMHPHITEIGYHNRDYFLGQWERFRDQPWGDLAHSTHLRGQGTWSPEDGERNRVTVTLATGIPRAVVEAVNLRYLDPASVDVAAYEADPDTFVEPHAGEVLYRLRAGGAQGRGAAGAGGGDAEPDGREPSASGLDG
ncbi:lactate racemase domain-containing protein [Microlunatus flavus]|uniref:Nickel-dependent lactate racemase n=1 Tax=Microlunatus flavus TaxID=1036181 RepID=A0A1H9G2N7_9ACTN|nr:lactate racemase domain-containing protein [Microlunatus flavus]SEQ44319.1 Nickel-dependent lactate racemase [Microlunatus flavus]